MNNIMMKYLIPKILHQIWSDKEKPLPAEFAKMAETWKYDYPEWKYIYWNEQRNMDMGLFSTGGYGYNNNYGEYGWDMDGGELDGVVIYGNYYGNDHYTEEEYWDMVYNGTWEGGYVDGWGYTFPDVYIFPGDGDYYTFPDYIKGSMNNFDYIFDSITEKLIGLIPLFGIAESQVAETVSRLDSLIQADLLEKNYNKNDMFYITYEYTNDRRIKCSVYDAKRGNFILSKEANIFGYVYE